MTEPKRVDWTIEDAPSCADCVHVLLKDFYVKSTMAEKALEHARCYVSLANRATTTSRTIPR